MAQMLRALTTLVDERTICLIDDANKTGYT